MNVSLTKELENYVQDKLNSGIYSSASEVVREGLRLLQEQDMLRNAKLNTLKYEINKGLSDSESDKISPLDTNSIKDRGRQLP